MSFGCFEKQQPFSNVVKNRVKTQTHTEKERTMTHVYHTGVKKHIGYHSYKNQSELSFSSLYILKENKQSSIEIKKTTILFLLKGKLLLSYNDLINKKLRAGEMILFSASNTLDITISEDVYGIFCTFNTQAQICDGLPLESLVPIAEMNKNSHAPLIINEWIRNLLITIENYWEDDLVCNRMYEIKKDELFCLLKRTYNLTDLATFFYPILNKDIFFKESVIKNYHHVRNVTELAATMGYSVSGFKKKFLRCFGMPAYTWMLQQKAAVVLKELKEKKKTIKDIFISNQFSSQAHLYEFCKKNFGKTPGQIRNGEQIKSNLTFNIQKDTIP